nr:MAG TPA: regulator protein [Caudoviricetes sp.]
MEAALNEAAERWRASPIPPLDIASLLLHICYFRLFPTDHISMAHSHFWLCLTFH